MEDFKWESGTNVLLGLWLILSPFFFVYATGAEVVSNGLAGAAIALLAAVRTFGRTVGAWASWVTAALGAWVVASPWVLGFVDNLGLTANNVLIGGIVIALAVVSALVIRRGQTFQSAAPPEGPERER